MALTYLATLASHPDPLHGEDRRSSWADVEFRTLDNGTSFTLRVNGGASALTFDLMQDASGGGDHVIYEDVHSESTVKLDMGKAYYIAKPKNAQNLPFTVEFWADV